MNRIYLFLVLCTTVLSVLAESPPSFCKCTCFTNSTIIPLSSHSNPSTLDNPLAVRAPTGTCAMCNRAFCLSQRLPICKDAEETDVFTVCFQRDSRKDQIVVLTFIASTFGLLLWAGARKILSFMKDGEPDPQQGYAPINGR